MHPRTEAVDAGKILAPVLDVRTMPFVRHFQLGLPPAALNGTFEQVEVQSIGEDRLTQLFLKDEFVIDRWRSGFDQGMQVVRDVRETKL